MKKVVVFLVMLCVGFTYAQKERSLNLNEDKDLIEVVYYHDNGEVSQTGYYTKDGKLHGDWFSYCKEGNKLVSAQYNNGVKTGTWFFWQDDKLREVNYTNGAIANVSEWRNAKPAIASNDLK
jgi:antitoxin component YwqK of YwqJK toxin-antitoxin module